MVNSGHARLMAAFVAATALHALLLWMLPSPMRLPHIAPATGVLHLNLEITQQSAGQGTVATKAKESQSKLLPSVQPLAPANPPHQPVAIKHPMKSTKTEDHKLMTIATAQPTPKQTIHTTPTALSAPTFNNNHKAGLPQRDDSTVHSRAKRSARISRTMQTRIMAQIRYPRQAMRHGWQGRTDLQFDVRQQSIATITLLASSGYPVLDRAARRGLKKASPLPLDNGRYQVPIIFHLQ